MVERNYNKPLVKINNYPYFWFNQRTAPWICSKCRVLQKKNVMATELNSSEDRKKAFLCYECLVEVLNDIITKATTCKAHGINGYKLFENI